VISVFYKPIFKTWVAFVVAMVVGLVVWIIGSAMGLGSIFEDGYTDFPSPLVMVLMSAAGVAVVVFVATFLERKIVTVLVVIAIPIALAVVIILLQWVLGTWGSKMVLIAIPVVLGLFMGMQLMLFLRKKVEAGVWVTFALVLVFAFATWWGSFIESNLLALGVILFYASMVAICIGYAFVFVLYTIWVRRVLGV
jgi:hypothetical protein